MKSQEIRRLVNTKKHKFILILKILSIKILYYIEQRIKYILVYRKFQGNSSFIDLQLIEIRVNFLVHYFNLMTYFYYVALRKLPYMIGTKHYKK